MTVILRANRLNRNGQAMVETALIIFYLITLFLAMTEFGRTMYTKNTLNNATRGIARIAVVSLALQESTTNAIICPNGTLGSTTPAATINLCSQYLVNCGGAFLLPSCRSCSDRTGSSSSFHPLLREARRCATNNNNDFKEGI
ncbi:MAG TPA: TadE/TadG family type IV pilus assembly protein [Geobacteraceae bacterium]|nr:TadE/TadG family type IV pilus assembly protein [Geobacteraceae bacterium]